MRSIDVEVAFAAPPRTPDYAKLGGDAGAGPKQPPAPARANLSTPAAFVPPMKTSAVKRKRPVCKHSLLRFDCTPVVSDRGERGGRC